MEPECSSPSTLSQLLARQKAQREQQLASASPPSARRLPPSSVAAIGKLGGALSLGPTSAAQASSLRPMAAIDAQTWPKALPRAGQASFRPACRTAGLPSALQAASADTQAARELSVFGLFD